MAEAALAQRDDTLTAGGAGWRPPAASTVTTRGSRVPRASYWASGAERSDDEKIGTPTARPVASTAVRSIDTLPRTATRFPFRSTQPPWELSRG